jgi:hypothetical protein
MPRFGVLSDQATRENFPEHQPIGLGKADFIHTVHLQKSPFTGIKIPKTTKSKFKHSDTQVMILLIMRRLLVDPIWKH